MIIFSFIIILFGIIVAPYGLVVWHKKKKDGFMNNYSEDVVDEIGYSRAMGIGLFVLGLVSLGAGIVGLIESIPIYLTIVIFGAALACACLYFYLILKKYNKKVD